MRITTTLTLLSTSLMLAACPDPSAPEGQAEIGADSAAEVSIDTSTGGAGDASGSDVGGDASADTTSSDALAGDAATDTPIGPQPGQPGWPCEGNGECDSGYCIEDYEGKRCTSICSGEDCPAGFTCEKDLAAFPDVVFVCVPAFPRLCFPCDTDDECREQAGEGHACISAGAPELGAFCGASCSGEACPEGWVCTVALGSDGASSQQCVPAPTSDGSPGVCSCSLGAIASGASTTCEIGAEGFDACQGQRICTTSGITDCDAPAPTEEICDGADNNCDGITDNIVAEACTSTNDFGTCQGLTVCSETGVVGCDAAVPSAEVCDGVDNDCNGSTDDTVTAGCTDYYEDGDGDGFGAGEAQCLCEPSGTVTATVAGDCDDTNANVKPGGLEVCNGIDDDCDSATDEENAVGCSLWNRDADSDGFGHPTDTKCFCGPTGEYTSKSNTDCDDSEATINPGQPEICDQVDNDCDGVTDEPGAGNCTIYYVDGDDDDFGDPTSFACLCAPSDPYLVSVGGDCDDGEPAINPGADEVCDTLDNDCDGTTDEPGALDCTPYYRDGDADDYGVTADSQCMCAPSGVYSATDSGDCNDGAFSVNPGATEVCNGIDDNCDEVADEIGAVGCADYFEDADGDGYGVGEAQCVCSASGTVRALVPGDCNDGDSAASPGLPELCDGGNKDEDCDGQTDEPAALGCTPFFADADGDTYGDPATEVCLCAPTTEVSTGGDCNDTPGAGSLINPGAAEVCNAFDDNCNGIFDEGCGLATEGWPTHKYDARRTGHRKDVTGPPNNSLRWKVQLPVTNRQVETTPLILSDGHILYAYNDVVYKLSSADGSEIWSTTLPVGFTNSQQGAVRASPTVREGGTIYVPTGNGMSLLGPDGALLWFASLGPDPEDAVRGTPTVDADGNAYFISNKFFTRMDPAGQIVWQLAIPNVQYTPGHAAWNLAQDRMYFTATNHVTYAVEPSGLVAWTFIDTGADIDGSCTVGSDGTIYSSMGDFVYKIQDTGPSALELGVFDTGQDVDACTSIYDDGVNEYAWVKPNGNNAAYRIDAATMNGAGSYSMSTSGAPSSAPSFDAAGTMYMGGGDGLFHAVNQDTSSRWTFNLDSDQSDGSAAIGDGFVVFADDLGKVYLIGD